MQLGLVTYATQVQKLFNVVETSNEKKKSHKKVMKWKKVVVSEKS